MNGSVVTGHAMIACLDVAYGDAAAYAAGIAFRNWADATPLEERVVPVVDVQPYQSGQFFRRELPCLLAALRVLPPVEVVIVDGYVWLGGPDKPGLGAHLFQALGGQVVVVGVAKTRFRGGKTACQVVRCSAPISNGNPISNWQCTVRGRSNRPLFVTAAGMSSECAAEHVRSMHGPYRIPTLLKRVDNLCRRGQAGGQRPF